MRVTRVEFQKSPKHGYSRWLHHAEVMAMWRGDVGDSVVMVAGGSNCDYRFQAGGTYLVYTHESKADTMGASVCSRTGLLAHRYYDRFFLGHPSVLYDASIQPVTLDTMVDVLAHDGAEADAMASDDPDVGVRCAVIELFAWWEYSPEVVRQIRRISRSDPDIVVREQAERYLERKDERSRHAPPYRTVADRGFSHPSNRKQRK